MFRHPQLLVVGKLGAENAEQLRLALGLIMAAPHRYFPGLHAPGFGAICTLPYEDDALHVIIANWVCSHRLIHSTRTLESVLQLPEAPMTLVVGLSSVVVMAQRGMELDPSNSQILDPVTATLKPYSALIDDFEATRPAGNRTNENTIRF